MGASNDQRQAVFSCLVHHRLCGSTSTVLMTTGQVNGRWQILTSPTESQPEPIATQFGTIDYVPERTPKTTYGISLSIGGFWANWRNITFCAFLFIPFFLRLAYMSVRRCLFGLINLIFNLRLFLKTIKIWPKMGFRFSPKNA